MSLDCPLCNKTILEDEKYYSFFNCRDCDQTFDMPYDELIRLIESDKKEMNERPIKAKDECYG